MKEKLRNKKTIVSLYLFLKDLIAYFSYMKFNILKSEKPKVESIDSTLDKIKDGISVVRFGDGEMSLIAGKSMSFNSYDKELAERLKNILMVEDRKLLVCIPDIFNSLELYNSTDRKFWRRELHNNRKIWYKLCGTRRFYNAFVTRLYISFKDKSQSKNWFDKFKNIFKNKEIILIEGKYSRLGYKNDLFKNAKSVKRILCPPKNAFEKYSKILNTTLKKATKDSLILVSLGPTAKPLVYDLYKKGYTAIDIGHIDLEYEWYLKKSTKKEVIENKFVNEVNVTQKFDETLDEEFEKQVIKRIL